MLKQTVYEQSLAFIKNNPEKVFTFKDLPIEASALFKAKTLKKLFFEGYLKIVDFKKLVTGVALPCYQYIHGSKARIRVVKKGTDEYKKLNLISLGQFRSQFKIGTGSSSHNVELINKLKESREGMYPVMRGDHDFIFEYKLDHLKKLAGIDNEQSKKSIQLPLDYEIPVQYEVVNKSVSKKKKVKRPTKKKQKDVWVFNLFGFRIQIEKIKRRKITQGPDIIKF